MTAALASAFRVDLRCSEADATWLANAARIRLPTLVGSEDDSDEDLAVRLQDPRVFGAFAVPLLEEARLPEPTRLALAERVFDLLPLPRSEGDVIVVESRAPSGLLGAAGFLANHDALTVIHVMHLVYAVFLDRSLVAVAPHALRQDVLRAVVSGEGASHRMRMLYVFLHLSAVPEEEAVRTLRGLLRVRGLPDTTRAALAHIAAAPDGGLEALARLAEDEGILPAGAKGADDPQVLANIPRVHPGIAAEGARWLRRHPNAEPAA